MIVSLFVEQLNKNIEFNFMMMRFDNDIAYVDGELRATFLLSPLLQTVNNLVLGIHFNISDYEDERFDNYVYTGLESLHKIELYDFNLEYKLKYEDRAKLLLIAQSLFPREYRLITETA